MKPGLIPCILVVVESPASGVDAEARRVQIFAENEPKRSEAGKLIKFVDVRPAGVNPTSDPLNIASGIIWITTGCVRWSVMQSKHSF